MEQKLEITKKLGDLAISGTLDSSVAMLNLPSANYCEKRAEKILVGGEAQQSCNGCVTQGIKSRHVLDIGEIKEVIDFFAENYGTKFITVNGRGDPFNPRLREDNSEKIKHAYDRWDIQAYVFTAGNNLDQRTCQMLTDHEVNVMISLFGNKFIDADFFDGKEYSSMPKPFQDKALIAGNLRRLITAYQRSEKQPEEGTTRVGMNYVVSLSDLADQGAKVSALKKAANANGLFFVSNTPFAKHTDKEVQLSLEKMANEHTNFNLQHSTAVNGQCQMGAGSSATVDFDGTLLRCPYMSSSEGNGKFSGLDGQQLREIVSSYMRDRSYPCVMRKHQK